MVIKGKTHVNTLDRDFNIVAGSYKASVTGDTYLEISGELKVGNHSKGHHITGANAYSVYGGDSYDGSTYVGGNVTVIIDIDLDHTQYFPVSGTYHSKINGDVNLIVKSGYVQEICAQQGMSTETQIEGNVHLVVGAPEYENTDRIVRPSGNWGICGTGNQFAPVNYQGQLYKVGGDVTVDTYENLWAWGEYNESYDYPPELHGAYYGDVGGDVTVNVHGSHLRNIYGAEESEITGTVKVKADDAELDNKEVVDPSIPAENKNGGGIYGASYSSCQSATIDVTGGSMYEVNMNRADAVNGAVINITGTPSIRGAVYGNNNLYKTDQKMVLNVNDAIAEIPTLLYFSDVNIGKESEITLGRAASGDIPFINVYDLNIKENAALTTKDGETDLLGDVSINDAEWLSLNETSISGNIDGIKGSVYFKVPSFVMGNASWDATTLKLPTVSSSGAANYDGKDNTKIALTIEGTSSGKANVLTVDKNDNPVAADPELADNYILSRGAKNQDSENEIIYYLANDAKNQGYYLKSVDDPRENNSYNNMWQVARKNGYGVLYGFKTKTKGKGLPDSVTDMLPIDNNSYYFGNTVNAIIPEKTEILLDGGKWKFDGYEESNSQIVSEETLKPGADQSDEKLYIIFNGVWNFYNTVSYEFKSKDGSSLPQEILNQLPQNEEKKYNTKVTPSVSEFDDVKTTSGVWKFAGWNPASATIKNDLTFTGIWEFEPFQYDVTYSFSSGTSGMDLPDAVTALLPEKDTVEYGGSVDLTINFESVEDGNGKWIFKGWTPEKADNIKSDTNIIGVWKYYEYQQVRGIDLVAYEGGLGSRGSSTTGDALPEPTWSVQMKGHKVTVDGEEWEVSEKGLPFTWKYLDENKEQVSTSARCGIYSLMVYPLEELEDKNIIIDDEFLLRLPKEGLQAGTVDVKDVTDNAGADNLSSELFKIVYEDNPQMRNILRSIIDGEYNENGTHSGKCDLTQPHAHIGADVVFYKNGKKDFPVNDNAKIGMLWDDLLSEVLGQDEQTQKLHEKSISLSEVKGLMDTDHTIRTDFQYIDLVDMNDGNLWVGTDNEAVTIYVPYTAIDGMSKDDEIAVTYFDGLTRDYTVDMQQANLDAEIDKSEAHYIEVEKIDTGILFEVPSKQFGSFEILFQKSFDAEYQFESADPDLSLPEGVIGLLPSDNKKYVEGSEVNAIQPSETSYEVSNGVWTFKGYDADCKTASEDLQFNGVWEFTADQIIDKDTPEDQNTPDKPISSTKPSGQDNENSGNPATETGDTANIAILTILFAISALGAIVIFFRRRLKKLFN